MTFRVQLRYGCVSSHPYYKTNNIPNVIIINICEYIKKITNIN